MTGESLAGKQVAVTGSTGFIGGALARRLLEEGVDLRILGRDLARAQPLIDGGAEPVVSDLSDFASFPEAVRGQEIVFHVAAWLQGDESLAHRINVDATRALAEACASEGVRRLVVVSSVAVYGLPETDHVDEAHPPDVEQRDPYGRTKALGELAAREVGERMDLEVVVLRPAMVYGPGGRGWTIGMLKLVQSHTPCLFGDADGFAFPLYVDNLVDALVLAGTRPEAAGEAFHLADASPTWARFMQYYGDMAGEKPRRVPIWVAKLMVRGAALLRIELPLDAERLELVQRPIIFDTEKARRLLGWSPAVSLDEGMHRSEAWLREQGRLPRPR